jgi:hypothetical protein
MAGWNVYVPNPSIGASAPKTPLLAQIEEDDPLAQHVKSLLPPEFADRKDTVLLFSARVEAVPFPAPGSIIGPPCARCGHRVWISPLSRRAKHQFEAYLCMDCLGWWGRGLLLARAAREE